MHSLAWMGTGDSGEIQRHDLRAPRKSGLEWVAKPASVIELTKAADEIATTALAVGDFMLNHFAPYGAGSWADSLCPGTLFEGQAESAIAWTLHGLHSRALNVIRSMTEASEPSERAAHCRDVMKRSRGTPPAMRRTVIGRVTRDSTEPPRRRVLTRREP